MWLILGVVLLLLAAGGAVVAWAVVGGDDSDAPVELAVAEPVDVTESFAASGEPSGPGVSWYVDDGAALGSTVALTGGVSNDSIIRYTTIVSTDAGRTWRTAKVTDADGEPSTMDGAEIVLAAERGWIAVDGQEGVVTVWVSQDGTSWQALDRIGSPAFEPHDVVTGGVATANGYLLVGYAGDSAGGAERALTWASTDGRSWERREIDRLAWGDAYDPTIAAHGSDVVVIPSAYEAGTWVSHDDGASWKPLSTPWEGGALTATPTGFAVAEDVFDVDREGYQIYRSTDGELWSQPTLAASPWDGSIDRLVSTNSGLALLTTDYDGPATIYTGDATRLQPTGQLTEVDEIAAVLRTDQGLLIGEGPSYSTTGDDVRLFTYTPGSPPQQRALPQAPELTLPVAGIADIATGNGVTIAVGGADGRMAAWTRADGGWGAVTVQHPQGASLRFEAVVHGPEGFLAMARSSSSGEIEDVLLRSEAGTTWQPVTAPDLAEGEYDYFGYDGLAADDSGYLVTAYVSAKSGSKTTILSSTDLDSWETSEKTSDSESLSATDVALDGESRVVLASDWEAENVGSVWWAEGSEWESSDLPEPDEIGDFNYRQVAISGQTVVAAGAAYPASDGDQESVPVVATSRDGGRTWSDPEVLDHDGDTAAAGLVLATSQGFVVVGDDGEESVAWTSSDGEGFERQALGQTQRDDALYSYVIGASEVDGELVALAYELSLQALDVYELTATLP